MTRNKTSSSMPLGLHDISRMAGVVSVRRLAIMCDWNPDALAKRMQRGSPELTSGECATLRKVLRSCGLILTTDLKERS